MFLSPSRLLVCIIIPCLLQSSPALAAPQTATAAQLTTDLLSDAGDIRERVFTFWQRHGPDRACGGFYGTLDVTGSQVITRAKGLVQQTRHIWAFSTFHLHGYHIDGVSSSSSSSSNKPSGPAPQPSGRRLQQQHLLQQQRQQQQQQPQRQQQQQQPQWQQQQRQRQQQQQEQQRRRQQHQVLTSKQMAQTAYDFVVRHMYDPSSGLFHWNVTREGRVIQDNKVIYGQWFVLYAFSQYYTAFKDPQARDLALQCFRAMDTAWHSSTYGGYEELPSNQIPPSPEDTTQLRGRVAAAKKASEALAAAAAAAAAAARGDTEAGTTRSSSSSSLLRVYSNTAKALARSVPQYQLMALLPRRSKEEPQERTLNVIMHGTEALTALHRITQDPVVLQRIREFLDILCTRLERHNGLIFEEYVPQPLGSNRLWTPAPSTVVNYGHNLESTWLVADTLDYLQSIAAIDPQLAQQYRHTVMSIGAAAVRDGYDAQHGGIFESGSAEHGPESKVKVWWVQAESMLALWKLHQYASSPTAAGPASAVEPLQPQQQQQQQQQLLQQAGVGRAGTNAGSNSSRSWGAGDAEGAAGSSKYLRALAHTARFVREHVTDEVYGEQFWQVQSDGSWQPSQDMDKASKGNRWKASYHNSRSVLFLEDWIRLGSSNRRR